MLTGGAVQRLLIYRNKVKYEGAPAPHVPATVGLTLLQWSTQIRGHLALPSTMDEERERLKTILRRLGEHATAVFDEISLSLFGQSGPHLESFA
ncbi:hypothetical protein H257_18215 [Aphanomyces astaci]|uniref:Uncharacterized protein n=1 Tax=Aphanomyces astaci TaxID=112090 RepID=W4FE10_APHAT|nr:hypothetical protein H257_18215 [Aphanomyces astaci]ETV64973.1 hypothetical protein H257_18215 [Aphanomyces astaci]|eukprot:XP_009845536.1 hypothetical protein H257_18215 [Aphanomyces astaci]